MVGPHLRVPARLSARLLTSLGIAALGIGALAGAAAASLPAAVTLSPAHLQSQAPWSGSRSRTDAIWESSNWSGYAETAAAPYSGVSGDWSVPTVTGPNGSYSAAWLGIDGFNDDYLIQTGTEQDFSGGSAQYSAWWTTSSQDFAEQTIASGCTTVSGGAATAPQGSAAPGSGGTFGAPGSHDPGPGRGAAPTATTEAATGVTGSAAVLNGSVDPEGTATSYYFEYGTSTAYGSTTALTSAGSGTGAVSVSAGLSGLASGSTYDFQLIATSSRGTARGGNLTLTTSGSSSGSGGASCGTVKGGDAMSAAITDTSGSSWGITLTDTTQGWSFSTTVSYSGPEASAEWIVEAPEICSGSRCAIATLADYGTTTFDGCSINGGSDNAALTSSEEGEMLSSNGRTVISIPSGPNPEADGFAIAYGSTAPPAPSS